MRRLHSFAWIVPKVGRMKKAIACVAIVLTNGVAFPKGADVPALLTKGQREACTLLARAMEERGLPGLTVGYARADGAVTEIALGHSAGDNALILPGAKFLSGSIGKTFVAAIAMDLYERGVLDLDAPVKNLLGTEDWYRRLPNSDIVTLRQLLTHSGGMPTHVEDPAFQKAIVERIHSCATCLFSALEAIKFVDGMQPLFAPGQGWAYSETGYLVAGMAIEKASGARYYDLLRERLLKPLGLSETIASDANVLPGLVSGQIAPDENYFNMSPLTTMQAGRLRYNPGFEWTGGGLAASSSDLVRWARLIYGGRALPEPYLHDLFTSVPTGESDARYGLAVGIRGRGANVSYGHTGSIPGYSSGMRYFPASDTAIAMQTNVDARDGTFDHFAALAVQAGALASGPASNGPKFTGVRCP
jgi:D-alanyl-D-alanine carboxypeptidase